MKRSGLDAFDTSCLACPSRQRPILTSTVPRMSQLDEALATLKAHDGVEHVVVAGADGLLVHHLGQPAGLDADRFVAMLPGLARGADEVADAAAGGRTSTTVLELEQGVAIVVPLSEDLLLALLLRSGVPFPALLREVRQRRGQLAAAV